MGGSATADISRTEGWSDERLVSHCLKGDQEAWTTLIKKYQNLIYSIPIKYGFSRDEAAEIFQQVCLQLLGALPALRNPDSIGAWLVKTTAHRCFHAAGREERVTYFDPNLQGEPPDTQTRADDVLREAELEQILRDALAQITPRCRDLIHMLFFTTPSVPYKEVANRLGIAEGSIGFIRMRCLKRLRCLLEGKGFA